MEIGVVVVDGKLSEDDAVLIFEVGRDIGEGGLLVGQVEFWVLGSIFLASDDV